MNLLQTLRQHGQSVWLDGLERNLILTGQLERSIDNGLRGVISNFTSLERAIRERSYDCDFRATVRQPNINAQWIYEYLTVQDMQLTADLMKAVHNRTHAGDGFVNLDLPPQVALDPQATLTEARRLWQTVGWSNLMLKVPATSATVSVIEQLIHQGININVTSLFSQAVYEQVAEAYLRGLEVLAKQGKEVSTIASVASFSVSRLDEAITALITTHLEAEQERGLPESFRGNAAICATRQRFAIAQAKVMYQRYQTVYQSDRWQALARLGAQPQRLLWDITNIRNARFHAQDYIKSLVGAGTVLALSPLILEEQDQYSPTYASLTVDVDAAHQTLENLEQIISLETIAGRLLSEELQRSREAYEHLLRLIEHKQQP
jgi:transaldolase